MVAGLLRKSRGLRALASKPTSQAIRRRLRRARVRVYSGRLTFGDLNRITPVSRVFGLDRAGTPVDRSYIESFLERNRADVAGRVSEVADDHYTRRFGGERVERSDVLSLVPSEHATLVADLCHPGSDLPWEQFDCIVFTQTLAFVADPAAAFRTLHRLLRPGGVLLVTSAGISQISRYDADRWGDRWRFTTTSISELIEATFGVAPEVEAFGNVYAAVAHLHGLVIDDLDAQALVPRDPDYEVVVTARVVKK